MQKLSFSVLVAIICCTCITAPKEARQADIIKNPADKNISAPTPSGQKREGLLLVAEGKRLKRQEIRTPSFTLGQFGPKEDHAYSVFMTFDKNADFCYQNSCNKTTNRCFKQYLHPGHNIILKNTSGEKNTEIRCCVRKRNSAKNMEQCGNPQNITWNSPATRYDNKIPMLLATSTSHKDIILLKMFELNKIFSEFHKDFMKLQGKIENQLRNTDILAQNHLRIGPDKLSVVVQHTNLADIQEFLSANSPEQSKIEPSFHLGNYTYRYDSNTPDENRKEGSFINNGQIMLMIASAEILAMTTIFLADWSVGNKANALAEKVDTQQYELLKNLGKNQENLYKMLHKTPGIPLSTTRTLDESQVPRFQDMTGDLDKLNATIKERNRWQDLGGILSFTGAIVGIAGMAIAMLETDYSLVNDEGKKLLYELMTNIRPPERAIMISRSNILNINKNISELLKNSEGP